MRVRLCVRPSEQFATVAVSASWSTPLTAELLAPYALIPFVIRRGSASCPDTAELRQQYEWRYGLRSSFELQKRGNVHSWQAQCNAVLPALTGDAEYTLEEAITFWWGNLLFPALEMGSEVRAFRTDYLSQEKQNIQRRIASQKNDAVSYAYDQTVKLTMRHDAHRFSIWGESEELEPWNGESLLKVFEDWKTHAVIDVYIQGSVDAETCKSWFAKFSVVELVDETATSQLHEWASVSAFLPEQVIEEWETGDGEQVKLNLAYHLPVSRSSDQFPIAMMLNGVLGGYAHSKLFQHVREKASLAYYASSRFDAMTERVMIQTGVAPEREEEARSVIFAQIESLQNGEITEDEWMQTKAMLSNALREREDDPSAWSEMVHANRLSGANWTLQSLMEALHRVTPEQVTNLAKSLILDVVYRYGPKHGGDEHAHD